MKFPGYFLIVADFIQWAKGQGIPVGPGRGSGAGSLVAWALTITDLDPMRFGLLFERFLNPERVSMPDFDIDFCQDRRDEVIAYVRERYGADRVAQIITFGSFLARGVLRNVGRVLEMPLGQVDRLAKLVPQNPAKPVTLKQAVADEARLQEAAKADERVAAMLAIAERLEGLYSNASTHAAGVVIADRPLIELVPLYRDPKAAMPATQFNMKWVEPAGLVKFDFLGLKTLTTLQRAIGLVARRGVAVDLSTIPLDDAKTFAMLGRGEAVGVFQVESGGMRKALVEMRADRFEDLIALVALYRPGPMANIPTYCARKLGEEKVEYAHPILEPILKETFGVITYQEQVQQIARDLAGYSLAQADILRRAMGKKIKAEMDAQRERFVTGAVERGVARATADAIFDACAKFAEYGFNKSHSAPYAFITYQTAWFKANHPAEFLAASMTLDKGNTDKLAEFRAEAERLGIKVAPPSANASDVDFDVRVGADGRPTIIYALSALKGVGDAQAEALVSARGGRAFASLSDMANRLDPRLVNKKALESLAAAGTFDELERDRAVAFASIEPMLAIANRGASERAAGQNALFGETEAEPLKVRADALERGREAQARIRRGRLFPLRPSARGLRFGAETPSRDPLGRFRPLGAGRRLDRSARRERARPLRAPHQDRIEDRDRAAFRPVRAVRGDPVPGGAEPVPRSSGEGLGRAGDAAGQPRGRGRAGADRQRRTAQRRRRQGPQGPEDLCARRGAARFDRGASESARRRGGVACGDFGGEGRRGRNPPARPLRRKLGHRRRAQGRPGRRGGRARVSGGYAP